MPTDATGEAADEGVVGRLVAGARSPVAAVPVDYPVRRKQRHGPRLLPRGAHEVVMNHRPHLRPAEGAKACGPRLLRDDPQRRILARRERYRVLMVDEEARPAQWIAVRRGDRQVERVAIPRCPPA